jgi:hypothetical protein
MAIRTPQPWEFRQLGPPNKTLVLDGPNAPYGRPRKGAVVEEELELRASVTYYPGNDEPDRHVFGTKQTPITLTGRFMDSRIGVVGGAQAKWDEMSAFVKDQIMVHAQWGGIYASTGLLTKCKRGAESDDEFTWSLTMEVNTDDTKPIKGPTQAPVNTSDQVDQIVLLVAKANVFANDIPEDIEFQPTFLDSIHNLLSNINAITGTFKGFAESVDNFVSELSSDVAHFRAAINQCSQACTQLQITLSSAENDPAVVAARGPSQNTWGRNRAEAEESLLEVLAVLAVIDVTAELVLKGTPSTTYTANNGDTWESIARSQLGSAGLADQLRSSNGAIYGTQPIAGQVIHIPKNQ